MTGSSSTATPTTIHIDEAKRQIAAEADLWEPEGFPPMTELQTPEFVDYIEGSCR